MHVLAALIAGWLAWSGATSLAQVPVAPPLPPAPRAAPAKATLPLWRVRDGERTVAWLLGSIHVLPKARYPLPAAIDQAFASSGSLVEEIDLAEMERPETLQAA